MQTAKQKACRVIIFISPDDAERAKKLVAGARFIVIRGEIAAREKSRDRAVSATATGSGDAGW